METRNLTCIGCPLGCAITVTMDGGNVVSITGNTCKRGSDYAAKEVTHPTRIVTSTVCVRGGSIPDGIRQDRTGYSQRKDLRDHEIYQRS